jgi:hypothetical protein
LAGGLFFDEGLRLLEQLVTAIATMDEGAGEFAGLQGHVELQVSYVVAEVFALVGGVDRLLRCRVHEGAPKNYGVSERFVVPIIAVNLSRSRLFFKDFYGMLGVL